MTKNSDKHIDNTRIDELFDAINTREMSQLEIEELNKLTGCKYL